MIVQLVGTRPRRAGEEPHQVFSTSRQMLNGDDMEHLAKKDDNNKAVWTNLKYLCEEISAWVHTGTTSLAADMSFSHDPTDISLLLTQEKLVRGDVAYYRPEVMESLGLRVLDAGHGKQNLCLMMSVVKSLIMQCLLLGIDLPSFVTKHQDVGLEWAGYFKSGEHKGVLAIARDLHGRVCEWMRQHLSDLKQRLQWFFETSPTADYDAETMHEFDRELTRLQNNEFLGEISMGALVTVMHETDHDWFSTHNFKIIMYGCQDVYRCEDRFVEILPYDFTVNPQHHVDALGVLLADADVGTAQPRLPRTQLINQRWCKELNLRLGAMVASRLLQVEELLPMKFAMFANADAGIHYKAIVFVGTDAPVKYNVQETIVGMNVVLGRAYWTGLPHYSRMPQKRPAAGEFLQAVRQRLVKDIGMTTGVETTTASKRSMRPQSASHSRQTDLGYNLLRNPDLRDVADNEVLTQVRSR